MGDRFAQPVLAGDGQAQVVVRDPGLGLERGRGAVAALGLRVAPGEGASARLLDKPVELYGA